MNTPRRTVLDHPPTIQCQFFLTAYCAAPQMESVALKVTTRWRATRAQLPPPTLTFTHPAWRAARIRHSGSGSGSSSRHPLGTPPNPVQGAAGEVAGELDGQHHARLFALLAGMSARRSARRSRHAKSCERLGVACLADAPPFAPGAVAACRAGNDSHRPAVDRIARAVCTSACLGR